MSVMTIRIPQEKHERLRALAQAKGVSVNKLMEEFATVALAQQDAMLWFRAEAARGNPQRALELLDRLDREEAEANALEAEH